MDFKDCIEFSDTCAKATITCRGTAAHCMLAWLDARQLKVWWKADGAMVEPAPGGVFYVSWKNQHNDTQHAIYGVVEKVDAENNTIDIAKILYIFPEGKMGYLHLHLEFTMESDSLVRTTVIHSHNYSGEMLERYRMAVLAAWPQTLHLFTQYIESEKQAS